MRIKNNLLLLGVSLLLFACSGSNSKDVKGVIRVDGSSTVYPITEAVAEEFRRDFRKVKVTIGISGSGGGFKKFCRGDIDISDASRPIKDSEIEDAKKNGISYLELEVAYDGLAVLVNPNNDWVDYFTVEELKKIWEPAAQEKIKYWNQIRPEWPDKEIHLFGPGIASGTYDYFVEAIVGKDKGSRGDFTASEDDNVLVQGVANDKYALGFFGLAYYEENREKLKLVGVDGGKGVVLPSLETVKDGTYAPLSRPLFVYVNSKAMKREEVIKFIKFYLRNASDLVEEVGYIPLSDEDYASQLISFESFIEGM